MSSFTFQNCKDILNLFNSGKVVYNLQNGGIFLRQVGKYGNYSGPVCLRASIFPVPNLKGRLYELRRI